MELKALWGFEGDPEKLKTPNGRVMAGSTINVEDDELAHALIGKGLVELVKPSVNKQAKSSENK